MNLRDTHDKVLAVVRSCETPEQLRVAYRMVDLWRQRLIECCAYAGNAYSEETFRAYYHRLNDELRCHTP